MINFIDLLNWAATIFVWGLGFLLVAGVVVGILNILLAPFLSKPKPRDWQWRTDYPLDRLLRRMRQWLSP